MVSVLGAIGRDTANAGVAPLPSLAQRIAGHSCPSLSPAVLLGGAPPSLIAPGWLACTPAPSQDRLSHAGPTSRSRGHYVWSTNPGPSFTGRLSAHAAPAAPPRCDEIPPLPGPGPRGLRYQQLLSPLRCPPASASFHRSFSSAPFRLHFPLTPCPWLHCPVWVPMWRGPPCIGSSHAGHSRGCGMAGR